MSVDATIDVVVILSVSKNAEIIVSDVGSFKQLTDSHSMHERSQKRRVALDKEVQVRVPPGGVDGLLEVKHPRRDEGSSFTSSSSVHLSDLAL